MNEWRGRKSACVGNQGGVGILIHPLNLDDLKEFSMKIRWMVDVWLKVEERTALKEIPQPPKKKNS